MTLPDARGHISITYIEKRDSPARVRRRTKNAPRVGVGADQGVGDGVRRHRGRAGALHLLPVLAPLLRAEKVAVDIHDVGRELHVLIDALRHLIMFFLFCVFC